MNRLRCNACGGEYLDETSEGVPYAHVCPPEELLTLRDPAGAETQATRQACVGLVLVDSVAAGRAAVEAGAAPEAIRVIVARDEHRRAGHRDENPVPGELEKGATRAIRHAGAGATVLERNVARPAR